MILSDISKLTKGSNKKIHVKCDECDIEREVVYKTFTRSGYDENHYLCRKCKSKKNNLEKYGVENIFQLNSIKEKSKKTIQKKYGVDNVSQCEEIQKKKEETNIKKFGHSHPMKNKDFREKNKNIILEKYGVNNISKLEYIKQQKVNTCNKNHGVDYISQCEDFKEKLKKHNLIKYGVECSLQSDEIKEKIKRTNLEKYGYEYVSQNPIIRKKTTDSYKKTVHKRIKKENPNIIKVDYDTETFTIYCDKCQDNFDISYDLYYKRKETNIELCTNCYEINCNVSNKEIAMRNFIEENYNGNIIPNHRLENRQELDIYLPDINLAFEFNGIYYHSDKFREKDYHYNKTMFCEENDIHLVHIWEDDWDHKREIVESLILNKLNKSKEVISDKNFIIKNVNYKEAKEFLNTNHIEEYMKSSIKLGIYYNEELVSIMTFLKTKGGYILNRFCDKIYSNVIDSPSILFNHFLDKHKPSKVKSFSNKSYNSGKCLLSLGFDRIKYLNPEYHYISNGIRESSNCGIDKELHKVYNSGRDEYIYT